MCRVQPPKSNYDDLLRLLGCIALILVGGAAVSPLLFWAGKGLLAWLHESGTMTQEAQTKVWPLSEIVRADFARYFNRAVLVAALVVLPLYARRAGYTTRLLPSLKPTQAGAAQFGIGFFLAASLLLQLGWGLVHGGVYLLRADAPWWGLGTPLTAALGASVVEEILFRGFVLGLLLRSMRVSTAVFWTTFVFALVHFLKPPEHIVVQANAVGWGTGFWLIGQILANFGHVEFLLADFCTLFAVGLVLAQARVRTRALWCSMGLHAGWVFGLKYFSALTRGSKPLREGEHLPWIGENLRIGLVPLVVVLITGWIAIAITRRIRSPQPPA
jgi:hypothetical protein